MYKKNMNAKIFETTVVKLANSETNRQFISKKQVLDSKIKVATL